ncbi:MULTISPECIES: M48 family metalloprotease [Pseudooceanicola]|uniref:M48 family metalloprotease n=1 Tax=Pseudooceanicola TaxID=1679449 RepID=UPI0028807E61|nr:MULTISPECIES: M48 family metalloprotease [Pseudooceanicola]
MRDPDIEHALSQLAAPVLQAVGLSGTTRILVIQDPEANAFVIDRSTIFLNSGMIEATESPGELQFVIAHEAAHIAYDHITRRRVNAADASRVAGLGAVLAIGGGALAGNAAAGVGAALGVGSSAERGLMAYSRAEETAADQAAIRAMASAGLGTAGAVTLMRRFAGQETLSASLQDPYTRSHPMSRDRLRALEALAQSYGTAPKGDSAAQAYWFARAQGKLSAFERAPAWTVARAKDSPTEDIRLMRLAIARHRQADWKGATALIDQALALRPRDPWYLELKGQILLEGRQFSAAEAAYAQASELAPDDALILASLGHAMVVQGGTARLKRAISVLERARQRDPRSPGALRDLGAAYAQTGQPGLAALSAAERHALSGRMHDAAILARRAAPLLSKGSPAWQRSQDVIFAAQGEE